VLQFLASLGSDLGFPSSQAKGFIAIPKIGSSRREKLFISS